jgi:hypothetical protein
MKLTVTQLVKKSPAYCDAISHHWHLSWARWIQSTHLHPIFSTLIFNVTFKSTPRPHKETPLFKLSDQNFVRTSYLTQARYMTSPSHFPSNNMWWKGKLSLSLIKHKATKTYEGTEVQIHAFLTSAVDGGEGRIHAPVVLLQGKKTTAPVLQEVGWAPELIWALWRREIFLASSGNQAPIPRISSP